MAPGTTTPRKWPSWLRRHLSWLVVCVLVAMAAIAAGARWLAGPAVPVQVVVQRDFTQSIVASGRVETPHRVDLGVQIVGTVAEVPVAEGQRVEVGTPLIRLEASELRAALKQAELAVHQAQARLRVVREIDEPAAEQALNQAIANHAVAARSLQRNRDLFEQKYIGQAALDDAVRAEQVARAQLRTAQKQLDGSRPGGSNAVAAEAALAQARAAAAMARARLGYTVVAAPLAGTLISRDVERGDVVQPGKALMVLSPDGDAQLVVQIDEKNLQLLRVGQDAIASADAYPEQRFAARVAYINPGIDAQRGSVEVKLAVPAPPDYLRQDMTVSVDVEVARHAAALVLPAEAVHDIDSRSPWVLRIEDGRARRRAVAVGLRSRGWCEITDGLRAGELVAATGGAASRQIADGSRVRPTRPSRS